MAQRLIPYNILFNIIFTFWMLGSQSQVLESPHEIALFQTLYSTTALSNRTPHIFQARKHDLSSFAVVVE